MKLLDFERDGSSSLELIPGRWLDYTPPSSAHIPLTSALLIGGGGLLGGAGSLVSGLLGSDAATSAARTQARASDRAAQLAYAMFQQYQSNLAPWMQGGRAALAQLQNLTGTADASGVPTQQPFDAPLTRPLSTTFAPGFVPWASPVGAKDTSGAGGTYGGLQFAPQTAYSGSNAGFAPTVPWGFNPTQATLEATPGYQFIKSQGLQATQNSFAAQGLGSSGAALKGAASYATGLASSTLGQQFDIWRNQLAQQYGIYSGQLGQQYGIFSGQQAAQQGIWQGQNALGLGQNLQLYNMLGGLAGAGQSAGTNLGVGGIQAGQNIGGFQTGGAAATAGGIVGGTNALTGGITGALAGPASAATGLGMLSYLRSPTSPSDASSINPLTYGAGYPGTAGGPWGGNLTY